MGTEKVKGGGNPFLRLSPWMDIKNSIPPWVDNVKHRRGPGSNDCFYKKWPASLICRPLENFQIGVSLYTTALDHKTMEIIPMGIGKDCWEGGLLLGLSPV